MTLTPPDLVSPAQPPTNGGVRELLGYAALTAAAYVLGVLVLALVFRLGP